jgi:disulfide bond formation protein DsbB
VQFLVEPFSFFGFEGQNWMLIVFFLVVAFVVLVWRTRDRFDGN